MTSLVLPAATATLRGTPGGGIPIWQLVVRACNCQASPGHLGAMEATEAYLRRGRRGNKGEHESAFGCEIIKSSPPNAKV